jgi:hypothetical protein
MGKMMHGTMSSQNKICAPSPPLSFLLIPVIRPDTPVPPARFDFWNRSIRC